VTGPFSAGKPLPDAEPSTMLETMPCQPSRPEDLASASVPPARRAAARFGGLLALLVFALVMIVPLGAGAHQPDHELEECEEEIRQHPNEATGYLHRAELRRTRRQWADATADLQTAARLDPELSVIDLSLAGLLLEAGNPAPAREAVDRFLARHPDHAAAHLLKARILVRLGLRRPAVEEFTRGIELARRGDGKGAQPDDYLQRARLQSCEGDEAAALRGLDEGIVQLGDAITLQLLAIELELSQSHWDGALARLAKIEAAARRKESWIARRAAILADAGRQDEAAKAWAEAEAAIEKLPASLRSAPATRELEAGVRASRAGKETPKDTRTARAPSHPDWCAAADGPAL
jgi:tetratricopeptide (TPR) repeat protein